MHDNRTAVEGRVRRFVESTLPGWLYRDTRPLEVAHWEVPGEPVPAASALAKPFAPVGLPHRWGAPWSTVWFRGTGSVPAQWRAADTSTRVEIVVDLGFYGDRPGFQAEGLAFLPDGTILKGIAPRSQHLPWDRTRTEVDVFVEAAANPDVLQLDAYGVPAFAPTNLGDRGPARSEPCYVLRGFDLALLDVEVWRLAQDIAVLDGLMRQLPEDSPRRWGILRALEWMLDAVDPAHVSRDAAAGRERLRPALSSPAAPSAHRLVAVGHAHIDTAWLWPVRETIRKCARTFSSAVALMDEHPEYRFACSSAQQLDWIKQHYPSLFDRVREKVRQGQFLPVGGMWVEPDMNMPGGEAMARQLVEGKKFFRAEFGVDCQEAWVPDSFGYSAGVPQVLAAAGIRWFLTQKLSWNQVNPMPHSSFWWEGIDGSRVFTHFPPVDTYLSDLCAADLAHAERTYRERGAANLSLVPFGWGDGGGGPTREMLAAAERLTSLEGSPAVAIGTPRDFFEQAEAEYPDPPVWSGELYLELHGGTLTSQHRTKQGNRRCEHLLREAELWAATVAVRTGAEYPYQELVRAWRTVLLNQFHDILPGTSIAWVHAEAEEAYAELSERLEASIAGSLAMLAGPGDRSLVANARPFAGRGVAALGVSAPDRVPQPVNVTVGTAGVSLDNGLVRAVIDDQGQLVSLAGRSGRDAVAPGLAANELRLYRDTPTNWDAWELARHYRQVWTGQHSVVVNAPTTDERGTVSVEIRKLIGRSQVTQTVSLAPGDGALELRNEVDWADQDRLLKLEFPLAVQADRWAAEVQFGHVFRPTHANTSWDAALFEACAHRWVHVGEPGYGVAIANESTYGHAVHRGRGPDGSVITTIGLSMLRGPKYPDPNCDQGRHTLTYRISPDATIHDAVQLGYATNLPLRELTGAADVAPLVTVSSGSVAVEAVKLAEDRSGDVIVRLYETGGDRTSTVVSANFACGRPRLVDLLEQDAGDRPPQAQPGSIVLTLRPFEMVTVRFPRQVGATREG